jgi:hypothetical protein
MRGQHEIYGRIMRLWMLVLIFDPRLHDSMLRHVKGFGLLRLILHLDRLRRAMHRSKTLHRLLRGLVHRPGL